MLFFQSNTECVSFLKTKEQKGWLECWYAINVTRNVLVKFVETKIKDLYDKAMQNLPLCTSAARTAGILYHNCHMENEIVKYNLLTPQTWKNANRMDLCSSYMEFAKCFIHAQGYRDKVSFGEFDLNALFSIMKNCKRLKGDFVSSSLQIVENVSILS